jgi:hypothetical protein
MSRPYSGAEQLFPEIRKTAKGGSLSTDRGDTAMLPKMINMIKVNKI